METGTIWLLIGLGAAVAFALVLWRAPPFDAGAQSITQRSAPPDEPCWTEEVQREGELSYGRYGCFHPGNGAG
jgi:hypothetical protein